MLMTTTCSSNCKMAVASASMAECIVVGAPPQTAYAADLPASPTLWPTSLSTRCDLSHGFTPLALSNVNITGGIGQQRDGKAISADDAEYEHVQISCSLTGPACCTSLQQLTDRTPEHCWIQHESGGVKAIFLDYDGTLREFEARPEQAVPTPEIMELLRTLDSRSDLIAHIISGRDAAFLQAHFGSLNRFTLIAEHGYQILKPSSGTWELFQDSAYHDGPGSIWKAVVQPVMAAFVTDVPQSHIEEKATALVWHYREACQDQAKAAAESLFESLEEIRRKERLGNIKISHGHKIVEVSYKKVNKGLVIDRLCKERCQAGQPFGAVLAVGDDKTDEFMFAAAPKDALTVKVGPGDTQARFRIPSPAAVRDLLRSL